MSEQVIKQPGILRRTVASLLRLSFGLAFFTYDYLTRIWLRSILQLRLPWKRAAPTPGALDLLLKKDSSYGKHRFFDVEGNTYHCVESGNPSGKLILLLHGFPQCWYTWRHQLTEFGGTDDYHVVALDLKGYGGSFKPTAASEYTPHQLAEDIEKVVHALGHSTCILVGHDWGGIIAWYCGALRPNFIEKLAISNAPHIGVLGRNLTGGNKEVSRWEAIKQLFTFQYIAVIQMPWPFYSIYLTWRDYEFIRYCNSDLNMASQADIDIYTSAFTLPGVVACAHAYYKSIFGSNIGVDTMIRVPTVVIWGNNDIALMENVSLSGMEDFVEDLQICIIDGATHFGVESSHKRFNAILREFINNGNDIQESNE
ncbi:Alpha/Beta hydrolase protein [Syncephalis fuscata]|nr:Alpha/Beta hydrolase protein [Syncephalis fuscata]